MYLDFILFSVLWLIVVCVQYLYYRGKFKTLVAKEYAEYLEKKKYSTQCDCLSSDISDLKHKISVLELSLEQYKKNPSQDCQDLLTAITSGIVVLKIEVIDRSDMFIWKPGKK